MKKVAGFATFSTFAIARKKVQWYICGRKG
jgi:hypothetical protein